MLLRQFPDIEFVRQLKNDTVRTADKWMNVALNVKCKEVSRTRIESPYSLFMNNKGFSYCTVNRMRYRIEDACLFTKPGELYDLLIDNPAQTEICNVHINREFFHTVSHALTNSSAHLLDEPYNTKDEQPYLFTQLYPKDDQMKRLTAALCKPGADGIHSFEAILTEIIEHILLSDRQVRNRIASMPFLAAAVRADIYKRIALACDYLHSYYDKAIELDEVCREIGMSKFHFLRVFKSCYKMTPYQYLIKVRMDKAIELLKQTDEPIADIADKLGFEYPNSFIKAFKKTHGTSPMQYRKQ